MGLDESLMLLVIAHEEGRHELARTPSVNVCSGNRRSDVCVVFRGLPRALGIF